MTQHTIDESVHSETLAICKTAVRLSSLVYSRAEHLRQVIVDNGFDSCNVLMSLQMAAVCCLVRSGDDVFAVWRGTNPINKTQRRANAKTSLVAWDHSPGRIHAGLGNQWNRLAIGGDTIGDRVMHAIATHIAEGRRIHLTGHSQAGGLANLTAAAMLTQAKNTNNKFWWPASLSTFGSMRAGDSEFASHVAGVDRNYNVKANRHGHIRFRNNNDGVTCLPSAILSSLWSLVRFQTVDGYRHACPERYIWPDGKVTTDPTGLAKLWQHFRAWCHGAWFEEITDHYIEHYETNVLALEVPEISREICKFEVS